ncbi:MAG: hypothetical protein AAF491_00690 [Verrucomicrobiota bacterium]
MDEGKIEGTGFVLEQSPIEEYLERSISTAMTQPQLVVQLPEPNAQKTKNGWTWLWFVLAIALSSAGGWFAHDVVERQRDTQQHAEVLRPFLAYNRDYDELRARAMNDDMRIVSFHVYQAWKEGLDLSEVLDRAMPTDQVPPNLKSLTTDRILENHGQAMRYGLYTPENLAALSMGRAPTVTKGEYAGEECQVEHIVPKNVVPLMDNLLVNLEYAQRYHDAGIMSFEDLSNVKRAARE